MKLKNIPIETTVFVGIFLLVLIYSILPNRAFAAGKVSISARVVSLVSDLQSEIVADSDSVIANNKTSVRIIVTARDKNGTLMQGKDAILESDHDGDLIIPSYQKTNSAGQAVFHITSKNVGEASYLAIVDTEVLLKLNHTLIWNSADSVKVLGVSTNGNKNNWLLISILSLIGLYIFFNIFKHLQADFVRKESLVFDDKVRV